MNEAVGVRQPGSSLDVGRLRADFPILGQRANDRPLVYLDNAASSQKPTPVLQAMDRCYREYYSNVHRGVHALSQRSTDAFEAARASVKHFIGAPRIEDVVFLRGTTEGINLVAHSYGRTHLRPGDEVLITAMEHHSNIVPWQLVCEATGARLKVAPVTDQGEIDLDAFERQMSERTRIVSVVHVSNALGTINPVRRMTEIAHAHGAIMVVDGAQAVSHIAVDVQELGCDFYAFSGHKVFGPTGIGVLYGRSDLLEAMPPYQGGGEMIRKVTFEETTYAPPPARFEAGTPNIVGAIGLGAALEYVRGLDLDAVADHENALLENAATQLSAIEGVRIIGTASDKVAVVSFVIEGVHSHDVATILDLEGVAIRAGHHCAQPLLDRFGVAATARASMAFYNTHEEVDTLAAGIRKVKEVFG